MNLNFFSRRKLARSIARTQGLEYVENPKCEVPNASKWRIEVPPYQYSFSKEEDDKWWHSFLHELYHHNHPNDFLFLESKKIKKQNLLVQLNNLVCDHKIEKDAWGEYEGRDEVMGRAGVTLVRDVKESFKRDIEADIAEALSSGQLTERPPEEDIERMKQWQYKMDAAMGFDILARQEWCHNMSVLTPECATPEAEEKLAALLEDETLFKDYCNAFESEEQWEVAKRMVNILEDDEEAGDKQEQEAQEGSGKGEPQEGEAASGQASELGDGEGEEESVEALAAKIKFEDVKFDHDNVKKQSTSRMDIDYSTFSGGDSYKVREPEVVSFEDGTATAFFSDGYRYESYADAIRRDMTGKKLSDSVRKYLIALKKGRWEGNKRSGKIHKRGVWKARTYRGTPSSMNIHKKKVIKNELDAAISIVIDQSGSMGGKRYEHAGHSAVLLNEVFAKIGVPVEIVSFTDTGKPINIIHKSFSSRISNDKLVDQIDTASKVMSGNSDGESVLWAGERLRTRKEKKRVMIVLSDGQPAGSGGSGIDQFTKDVVKSLEKTIDVHGIGIQSDSVRRYYKSNEVINDPSQLETALLNVLKNKVLEV